MMASNPRALALSALVGLLLCAPASARAKHPLPCDGGRFVVSLDELASDPSAARLDVIAIDPSSVAVPLGCVPVGAHVGVGRGGTAVSASWRACTGLHDRNGNPAKARLVNAVIAAPACDTLTGTLVVSRGKPRRRRFSATRSRCGDGYLDVAGGEECGDEGAPCLAGTRCTDTCTCELGGTTTTSVTTSSTTTTSTSTRPTSTSTSRTSSSSTSSSSTTTASTTTATRASTTATTSSTTTTTHATTTSTTSAPTTSSTTTSTTVATSTTTSSTTTTTLAGGGFTCTEVIGFSQTLQWWQTAAFQQQVTDARWQVRLHAGGDVDYWADPTNDAWNGPPVVATCTFGGAGLGLTALCSPCAQGSDAPDRVIFTITLQAYESDVQVWAQKIRAAIATIRAEHPHVRQIVLQPVIGGPMDAVCPVDTQPLGVRASYNHPFIEQAIQLVVGDAPDLVAGISPDVQACSDYADDVGHLTAIGGSRAGLTIGSYYADAP